MSRKVVAAVAAAGGAMLLVVALVAMSVRAQVPPSSEDCPVASRVDEFTQSGEFTTDFIDAPAGQLYVFYEFPNVPSGVAQRLNIDFERDAQPTPAVGRTGILKGPANLTQNQGQAKLEDVPGRYRLKLSPSDPDQEYAVTVYSCDPSGGESTVPRAKAPPSPPKTSPPSQPKAPSPAQPQGPAFKAGGPSDGSVPRMPGGGCPKEFSQERGGVCFRNHG